MEKNDWLPMKKEFISKTYISFLIIMSTDKQVDDDNETVASSTEKTDEQEENQSKSSDSDNDDTDSNASSEYEVVSFEERLISR